MSDMRWQRIAPDVKLGQNVTIYDFVNLYGCEIGDGTKIGTFVEIQKGARVGRNCKISSHSFICEGVAIEDEVFVGHHVVFINDRYPRATAPRRSPANRGRLAGCSHACQTGRLDWFRRSDPVRGDHWRGGNRGRRERRHP